MMTERNEECGGALGWVYIRVWRCSGLGEDYFLGKEIAIGVFR